MGWWDDLLEFGGNAAGAVGDTASGLWDIATSPEARERAIQGYTGATSDELAAALPALASRPLDTLVSGVQGIARDIGTWREDSAGRAPEVAAFLDRYGGEQYAPPPGDPLADRANQSQLDAAARASGTAVRPSVPGRAETAALNAVPFVDAIAGFTQGPEAREETQARQAAGRQANPAASTVGGLVRTAGETAVMLPAGVAAAGLRGLGARTLAQGGLGTAAAYGQVADEQNYDTLGAAAEGLPGDLGAAAAMGMGSELAMGAIPEGVGRAARATSRGAMDSAAMAGLRAVGANKGYLEEAAGRVANNQAADIIGELEAAGLRRADTTEIIRSPRGATRAKDARERLILGGAARQRSALAAADEAAAPRDTVVGQTTGELVSEGGTVTADEVLPSPSTVAPFETGIFTDPEALAAYQRRMSIAERATEIMEARTASAWADLEGTSSSPGFAARLEASSSVTPDELADLLGVTRDDLLDAMNVSPGAVPPQLRPNDVYQRHIELADTGAPQPQSRDPAVQAYHERTTEQTPEKLAQIEAAARRNAAELGDEGDVYLYKGMEPELVQDGFFEVPYAFSAGGGERITHGYGPETYRLRVPRSAIGLLTGDDLPVPTEVQRIAWDEGVVRPGRYQAELVPRTDLRYPEGMPLEQAVPSRDQPMRGRELSEAAAAAASVARHDRNPALPRMASRMDDNINNEPMIASRNRRIQGLLERFGLDDPKKAQEQVRRRITRFEEAPDITEQFPMEVLEESLGDVDVDVIEPRAAHPGVNLAGVREALDQGMGRRANEQGPLAGLGSEYAELGGVLGDLDRAHPTGYVPFSQAQEQLQGLDRSIEYPASGRTPRYEALQQVVEGARGKFRGEIERAIGEAAGPQHASEYRHGARQVRLGANIDPMGMYLAGGGGQGDVAGSAGYGVAQAMRGNVIGGAMGAGAMVGARGLGRAADVIKMRALPNVAGAANVVGDAARVAGAGSQASPYTALLAASQGIGQPDRQQQPGSTSSVDLSQYGFDMDDEAAPAAAPGATAAPVDLSQYGFDMEDLDE